MHTGLLGDQNACLSVHRQSRAITFACGQLLANDSLFLSLGRRSIGPASHLRGDLTGDAIWRNHGRYNRAIPDMQGSSSSCCNTRSLHDHTGEHTDQRTHKHHGTRAAQPDGRLQRAPTHAARSSKAQQRAHGDHLQHLACEARPSVPASSSPDSLGTISAHTIKGPFKGLFFLQHSPSSSVTSISCYTIGNTTKGQNERAFNTG